MLADQPTRRFTVGLACLAADLGTEADQSSWTGSTSDLIRAARLRQELAVAKARADSLDDAGTLAEGAIRIYRRLAERNPARYRPELAIALIMWGLWSARLGQPERAAPALADAVRLHRGLLETTGPLRPMRRLRLRIGLVVALTNLGSARSELGEHVAGAEAAEEAVRRLATLHAKSPLCRLVCRRDPLGYQHCLAGALNNLGVILAERGDSVLACELAELTARRYRALAAEAPLVFEPELAKVLHNLGLTSAEVGRTGAALAATREAVDLHRCWPARSDLERGLEHSHQLGRALCAFAEVRARAATELAEALRCAEEAVRLLEQLAQLRPRAFSADLHAAYRTAGSVRTVLAGPPGEPYPPDAG